MKHLILFFSIIIGSFAFGQAATNGSQDCGDSEFICNDNGTTFDLSTGQGAVEDLPAGNSTSNPSTNPGAAGNSGCLLSNELNPNWFVINIGATGVLEFTVGSSGSSGFYDWALWPYYTDAAGNTISCSDITNNTLAPVACNWNGSSAGFTGMFAQGNLPSGANQNNFEYAINVVAGEQYVLCFSNYSAGSGNVPLIFGNDIPGNNNPGSAAVTCIPNTPDQTICNGTSATVDIIIPPVIGSPTFNWLVTTGVSNTTGGTGVIVTPTVTTDYYVEIFDAGVYITTDTFTIYIVEPPVPNAGIDQTICLGDQINLAGIPSDPTNSLLWQYTAPVTVPAANVSFSPNFSDPNAVVTVDQVGTYQFYLREGNITCGNVLDTMEVIVTELTITATSTKPSCIGLADGQIDINSAEAIEYSFDNGITWQVDSFAAVFNAGTYDVCGRNALGCMKCTQVTVIDPPPVVVSVSNDTLICQNGTGYLSASATGGTSYLYHWDFTANTSASQNVNPIIGTTYTVIAENENGCMSPPESIIVTIRPPLSGTITSNDTVCPTYSTDIAATVMGGIGQPYTFTWSTGDTYTGIPLDSIEVTPNSTTDYTVTITDGCESTPLVLQTNVRVSPLPVPSYLILNPDQCEPATFDIVNTTDPTMSQYVYWNVDDNVEFFNEDTITTQEFMAGQYSFQMIVTSYEGCLDSIIFYDAINVIPKPIANFYFSPNPVTIFNTQVEFVNHSINGDTYQWFFEGATPSTSTADESITINYPEGEQASYNAMLITTSDLGCVDTLVRLIRILPEVILYAPNTFTPDGDQYNQTWKIYMEGVDIYDFNLFVYNRWGQVVWESHDPSIGWDGQFNGRSVMAGAYTWVIDVGNIVNDERLTYSGNVNIIR